MQLTSATIITAGMVIFQLATYFTQMMKRAASRYLNNYVERLILRPLFCLLLY